MSIVVRASTAGFCTGVVLALEKLDALLREKSSFRRIYTLGPIIHNPHVQAEYARKGVFTARSCEEIPPGATAVIRAHGVPKDVHATLSGRGVRIVDATCPRVRQAQLLIESEAQEGRVLLLYGDENHPEVRGLLSYASNGAYVFPSKERLAGYVLKPGTRYCLAAQTTQDQNIFGEIAAMLRSDGGRDVKVLHTICDTTRLRQEETVRIARATDFMIVVGGLDSGNTRRLAQVAASQGKPCLHVESVRDLPLERLRCVSRIGLTAGASTPEHLIDEIHRFLESFGEIPEDQAAAGM